MCVVFSHGDWSLGFILDDNSIHLLEFYYNERMNPSNDDSLLDEDNPLTKLKQSLRLETSQQTIKSLQDALLNTKKGTTNMLL